VPDINKTINVRPTLGVKSKSFKLRPEKYKPTIDGLAPLIYDAIKESGIKLTESEKLKLDESIAKGVSIKVIDQIGNVARVSGSVAGSVSVDW